MQHPDLRHPRLALPVGERDHVLGEANAPVTMVLYGDYQCPYTARVTPIVADLLERRGDVRFAYRNFPLRDIHPNAQRAAETAESAGRQGRFWEMHFLLFSNFRRLDGASLLSYAERLGLDLGAFVKAMSDDALLQKIDEDRRSGEASGVESTPTFYINGARYDGRNEEEDLNAAIEQAMT